ERLLGTAEQVAPELGDVVSQGVRVQVTVESVVAVSGIEADFDVILGPLVTSKDVFYLPAKVPLNLKNQTADALAFVGCFVGQNLLREGEHAAGGFATADGAQDGNSREQAALGNSEPKGSFGGHRFAG